MENSGNRKGLSVDEESFAMIREETYRGVQSQVFSDYLKSPDPAEFMRVKRAYVAANQESRDPAVQGTVDAYEAFVQQVDSMDSRQ